MRYFGIIWAAKSKPISKLEIFLILFFLISPVFWFSKISPLNEHIRKQFFVARYLQRKFMFIFVLLDGFFVGSQYFDSMYLKSQLSWAFLGYVRIFYYALTESARNVLIVGWANAETISSLTESMQNQFFAFAQPAFNIKSKRKWYI
jgi:hypothetical protein